MIDGINIFLIYFIQVERMRQNKNEKSYSSRHKMTEMVDILLECSKIEWIKVLCDKSMEKE
jgi:hypothetical protein